MPDLSFHVEGAEPQRNSAAPHLLFSLRVTDTAVGGMLAPIQNVALRCQIRIEPARRRYQPREQAKLRDLFGEPERWGQTLRPMLWTHLNIHLPPFTGAAVVDLPVPCSFDFSVAASKYFDALESGDIPLCFLFSGTIFYEGPHGGVQVAPIPWEKEAYFKLPTATWKSLMEMHYSNSAWLCLRKDVFDRMCEFRSSRGLASWEQTFEKLLSATQEMVS